MREAVHIVVAIDQDCLLVWIGSVASENDGRQFQFNTLHDVFSKRTLFNPSISTAVNGLLDAESFEFLGKPLAHSVDFWTIRGIGRNAGDCDCCGKPIDERALEAVDPAR
jgi:hypothetical protein